MSVAVVDIGVGNTASVLWALERLGVQARLSAEAEVLTDAERLIFPGVGSAAFAVKRLNELGLWDLLIAFPRPLLGVCLGMQLLFERSAEGDVAGLGLLTGEVVALEPAADRPVPHMGWNTLELTQPDDALVEGLGAAEHVYYVHGFAAVPSDTTVATSDYGRPFAGIVRHGQVCGCQFHPERSGPVGARILRNFLDLPC